MNRELVVPGVPIPQGSKRHVGGGIMVEANKKLRPWRDTLAAAMIAAGWASDPILMGPVSLDCCFHLPRPKAHYKADGTVRPNAPLWHDKRGDLDKLLRAVGDALTASGAIRDDAQIAVITATKSYSPTPSVWIRLRPATEPFDLTREQASMVIDTLSQMAANEVPS